MLRAGERGYRSQLAAEDSIEVKGRQKMAAFSGG